jgi:hypothetical protein
LGPTDTFAKRRDSCCDEFLARTGTLGGPLVTKALTHVELHGKPTFGEQWALVHFMAGILTETSRL